MKFRFIILTGLLSLSFAHARAGSGSSGGGNAVVCYENEVIKSVELLDIYEARVVHKLTIKKSLPTIEQEYIRYMKDSRAALGSTGPINEEGALSHFRSTLKLAMRFVPEGQTLPILNDSGRTPEVPSNCKIEQLAVFYDHRGSYDVNKTLWDRLNGMNRLALFIHEALYSQYRRIGEVNSENVRAYTAAVFSVENSSRIQIQFPAQAVYCHIGTNVTDRNDGQISIDWGKNYAVVVFFESRNRKGEYIGQFFDSFFGRELTSITQFSVPFNLKMSDLTIERNEEGKSQVAIVEPSADFTGVAKLISSTPVLYSVKINYQYGSLFSLSLLDSNGKEYLNKPFSYCFQNPPKH
jgi:hypothetical protein